jgi:hypothetical protein
MATSQVSATNQAPAAPAPKLTTKKVKNLDTFEDVLLAKTVPTVPPVVSVEEALHRVGNDHKKLLSLIQEGLQADAIEQARNSNDGWFETDEDGDPTDVEFTGTAADSKVVNFAILNVAKIMFDFDAATTKEQKREAKKLAAEEIKSNPRMLASLQKRAAPKSE